MKCVSCSSLGKDYIADPFENGNCVKAVDCPSDMVSLCRENVHGSASGCY
jgi:hypothetical protein